MATHTAAKRIVLANWELAAVRQLNLLQTQTFWGTLIILPGLGRRLQLVGVLASAAAANLPGGT
jgi:hypothetical protein